MTIIYVDEKPWYVMRTEDRWRNWITLLCKPAYSASMGPHAAFEVPRQWFNNRELSVIRTGGHNFRFPRGNNVTSARPVEDS